MKKILMIMILVLSLVACSANTAQSDLPKNRDIQNVQNIQNTKQKGVEQIETPVARDTSKLFEELDFKTDYDQSDAIEIDVTSPTASSGVSVEDGAITITKGGVYLLNGSSSEKQIIVDAQDQVIHLVLDSVELNNIDKSAIYVKSASHVYLTLSKGSSNLFEVKEEIADDSGADAVIYANSNLTINAEGTLNVISEHDNGISSEKEIRVTGGKIVVKSGKHALSASDEISIASGVFELEAIKDALHSENEQNSDSGNIYIKGGQFSIKAQGEAFDAISNITVDAGEIHVLESDEAVEAETVDIHGGRMVLTSSDDAINASYTDKKELIAMLNGEAIVEKNSDVIEPAPSAYVNITSGEVIINSEGDGIDSNGSIYISGGVIQVQGPISDGNSIMDYDLKGVITGGELIGSGSSGMLQGFSSESTQASIKVVFPSSVSGNIRVEDKNKNEVLEVTHSKAFSAVIISSPKLKENEKYTVTAGGQSVSTVAQSSADQRQFAMPQGQMPQHNRQRDPGLPNPKKRMDHQNPQDGSNKPSRR